MNTNMAKLVVAIVLDILDFTVGRIPGFELVFDAILGVTAVILWGWPGLIAFWELADPTGQVDGFVPTMTLIALSQMGKGGKSKRPPPEIER
jgi:hypothetical protein